MDSTCRANSAIDKSVGLTWLIEPEIAEESSKVTAGSEGTARGVRGFEAVTCMGFALGATVVRYALL
jgi:hypothetical protein